MWNLRAIVILLAVFNVSHQKRDDEMYCDTVNGIRDCYNLQQFSDMPPMTPEGGFSQITNILLCTSCNLTFSDEVYHQYLSNLILFEAQSSTLDLEINLFRSGQAVDIKSLIFRDCKFVGTSISNLVAGNRKVKELVIAGSKIRKLDNHLDGLLNLEVLRLNHNQIRKISENAFTSCPELKILYLSYNKFVSESLANKLNPLEKLEELSLKGNLLRQVSPGLFPNSLKVLDLSENPIHEIAFHDFVQPWKKIETLKLNQIPCSTLNKINKDFSFTKEKNVACKTKLLANKKCNSLQITKPTKNTPVTIGEWPNNGEESGWWLDHVEGMACIDFGNIVTDYEGDKIGLEQAAGEMLAYHIDILKQSLEKIVISDSLSDEEHKLVTKVQAEAISLNNYQRIIENQITVELQ